MLRVQTIILINIGIKKLQRNEIKNVTLHIDLPDNSELLKLKRALCIVKVIISHLYPEEEENKEKCEK